MKTKLLTSFFALTIAANSFAADRSNTELADFGETFGLVRYFSPNPHTSEWSESDWYKVCYHFVCAFCAGEEAHELFTVLAPRIEFTVAPTDRIEEVENSSEYYYWRHVGSGFVEVPKSAKVPKEYRDFKPFYKELCQCSDAAAGAPVAGRFYSFVLTDGKYCNLPIAENKLLFSKTETDALLTAALARWDNDMANYGSSMSDRIGGAAKNELLWIADIIYRWNAVEHFYPYYVEDSLDQNWCHGLAAMIVSVIDTSMTVSAKENICARFETIRALMNPVKDSHLIIGYDMNIGKAYGTYINYSYLPLTAARIDDKIVVTAADKSLLPDIAAGTVIETIDGIAAMQALEAAVGRRNWSNRAYGEWLCMPDVFAARSSDRVFDIGYRSEGGELRHKQLKPTTNKPYYIDTLRNSAFITSRSDGTVYVNACSKDASYKTFRKNLEMICQSAGVVFDLRGYPTYEFDRILAHLSADTLFTSFLSTPVTVFPHHKDVIYRQSTQFIAPLAPKVEVPITFLCNHMSMSWAETILILTKGYGLGTIVGSATCGTNGDATRFDIPFFAFRMSANRATNCDGTRHHGIGVVPDTIKTNE